MSGCLVVLEGLDGAGTTTQGRWLAGALTRAGQAAHFTGEPSTGRLGVLARTCLREGGDGHPTDPHALALLFAADRLDHLAREILPMLAAGTHVVCDRYLMSSLAYQSLSCDMEWVAAINRQARRPDLTLWLDVTAEVAATRRARRGGRPDQYEVDDVQRQVARHYAAAAARPDVGRVCRVDGTPEPARVGLALWALVAPVCGLPEREGPPPPLAGEAVSGV